MKKFLIILLALLFALPVEAAEFTVTQDDSGVIIVTASADAGKNVHLQVLKADKVDDDLSGCTPEELINVIAFEQTVTADDRGKAVFRFRIAGDTGNYQMKVRAYGEDAVAPYVYQYFSLNEMRQIVEMVIAAKSSDDVKTALSTKNLAGLGITSPLVDEVDLSGLYQRIFEIHDTFDLEKMSEFVDAINEALVLEGLRQRVITDPFLYNDILRLSAQISYPTYDKMSGENQEIVKGKLIGTAYGNIADVQKQFCEQTILTAVAKLGYWKNLSQLLKDNNAYLQIDFSVYDGKNGETYEIDSQIAGKLFSSTDALKQEWRRLLNQQSKPSNSGGGSSQGGGGGFIMKNPYPELLENDPAIVRPHVDFVDLDEAEWAKESIDYLYIRNVINGVGGMRFEPNTLVKREEFVKMLVCALELYDDEAMSDFSDSNYLQWHYSYVSSAYRAGIVAGMDNGAFGIGNNVTRQDMAVMCFRARNLPSGECGYADAAEIAPYASEAVGALTKAGVLSGAENRFRPNDSATRAEAAKMIHRIMLLKEAE